MTTLKEIQAKMKGYRLQDQASRDVHSVIQHYKDLKIGTEQFVYPEGRRDNLFRLKGTIPVSYRGITYNIPIVIWLQKGHPQHNPIPYVTPTPDMSINPSRYVDASGRVYLPYISEWKQGTSDLVILTQILCATFAESIPVYKRQQQQPQGYAPPTTGGGYHPPAGGYQPPSPYNNTPTSSYYPRQPQPQPPRPPYHHPNPASQPTYSNTPYPSGQASMPMPGGGYNQPYPPGPGGYQPQPSPPYPGGYQPHPTQSYQQPGGVVNAQPQMSGEDERRRKQEEEKLRKEAERMSLESAVEDKIRRQLQSVLKRAKEEMTTLETTQKKLKDNQQKLLSSLQDMDEKQGKIDSNVEMLKIKTAELQSVIDQLESQPDTIDPDDAVCASNPVYNQILNLYAEENAIEDALYYLGEALRKGVITHEVFLKNVRDLSRKQFMARATIMKARDTAKLVTITTA